MKKILVIRIGNIGDVLMATPLIKKLKGTFPQAELHFLTSPHAEFIVRENPYIDRVYVYKKYAKIARNIKKFFFRQLMAKNIFCYRQIVTLA